MDSTQRYFAISIGMSLFLHFILFNVANRMPAFKPVQISKEKQTRKLKPVRLKSIKLKKFNDRPKLKFNVNIKESPTKLADALKKQGLKEFKNSSLKPLDIAKKPAEILGNSPDLKSVGISKELPPNVYHIKTAPLESLAKTGMSPKTNFKDIKIKTPGKGGSLASSPQNLESGITQAGLKRSFPKITPPNLKFKARTPNSGGRSITSPVIDPTRKTQNTDQPGEMEFFLNITPYVYIDTEDDIGYFRLDLSPNSRANGLNSINKDVLFLVDSSKSISSDQLSNFKKGLSSGLESLNTADRFNIIDFTTKSKPCFTGLTQNTLNSINQAAEFIEDLNSYGKTDVYSSLKPYVTDAVSEKKRPILLFLLTDGVSTVSESKENSEIIQKITENNKENVSVFGFSCGDDINSFLIDFLTYRNRGDSLIINGLNGADTSLSKYISARSEILVSNLNYRYMGQNKEDLFPKNLPHLYKNKTLSIFGTFNLSEKENMIQLLGNSSAGSRQLIYKLIYEDANRAGRDLAKSWAAQKIFHLIGRLTDKKDPEVVSEIRSLQQKFEVYVPYELPK